MFTTDSSYVFQFDFIMRCEEEEEGTVQRKHGYRAV